MDWFEKILDFFFPRSEYVRRISKMDAGQFYLRAKKNEKNINEYVKAIFSYKDGLVRAAIWQLKYRNDRRIAKILAEILYAVILEDLQDLRVFRNFDNPLIVSVPISKNRRRERGYNQCELVLEFMKEFDSTRSLRFDDRNLIKTKDTQSQSRILNKKKRLANVVNSFKVKDETRIKGKNIILIDDVVTTGATLSEAGKALIDAGAKRIYAYTIAH